MESQRKVGEGGGGGGGGGRGCAAQAVKIPDEDKSGEFLQTKK